MNNTVRLKSFLRNVVKASKRINSRNVARQELQKQVTKVKRYAIQPRIKKETLDLELEKMYNKIELVLDKEANLLEFQKRDTADMNIIKQKVFAMEEKLDKAAGVKISDELKSIENQMKKLSQYDVASIQELKDKVIELEHRIKAVSADDLVNEFSLVKNRLDNIIETITIREKRVLELEKKIAKSVDESADELMMIEEQIYYVDQRLEELKKKGDVDSVRLDAIAEKLGVLKQKRAEKLDMQIKKFTPAKIPEIPKIEPKEQVPLGPIFQPEKKITPDWLGKDLSEPKEIYTPEVPPLPQFDNIPKMDFPKFNEPPKFPKVPELGVPPKPAHERVNVEHLMNPGPLLPKEEDDLEGMPSPPPPSIPTKRRKGWFKGLLQK